MLRLTDAQNLFFSTRIINFELFNLTYLYLSPPRHFELERKIQRRFLLSLSRRAIREQFVDTRVSWMDPLSTTDR